MGRPRIAALAVLAAVSCVSDAELSLEFDPGRICTKIALEVLDEEVLPGWTVHAMAVERSDGDRAWALATGEGDKLKLVAWPDGPAHDFSAIGERSELHLVPGAVEGETWVLLDRATQAQVWRVREDGQLLAGPALADFPEPGIWTHRLVFVDHAAHILSVPATGEADTLELLLSRLDETLAPEPAQRLALWNLCSEGQVAGSPDCDVTRPDGPLELEVVGTSMDGSASGMALIAIYWTTEVDPEGIGHGTMLASVELRPDRPGGSTEMVRRDLPFIISNEPLRVSTASIASDRSTLYGFTSLRTLNPDPGDHGQQFLFVARRSDFVRQGRLLAMPAQDLQTQVMQVGGDVARAQVQGQVWSLAPMHELRTDHEAAGTLIIRPGARVASAGRGQFLVRHISAGAWRVGTRCDEDDAGS